MVHLLRKRFCLSTANLELFFKTSLPIKVFVNLLEFIQSSEEVRGWYLSVSTDQCLQNSIMNKCILILQEFSINLIASLFAGSIGTYNCLDHLHSLSPHVNNDLWYVHLSLFGGLGQSYVNGNQCPCSTHSSTTIELEIVRTCMQCSVSRINYYIQCTCSALVLVPYLVYAEL